MNWLKENIFPIIISAAIIILSTLAIVYWPTKPDHIPDSSKMVHGVDIAEYSVAGGGVQRVITFSGDTATYEVVITDYDR